MSVVELPPNPAYTSLGPLRRYVCLRKMSRCIRQIAKRGHCYVLASAPCVLCHDNAQSNTTPNEDGFLFPRIYPVNEIRPRARAATSGIYSGVMLCKSCWRVRVFRYGIESDATPRRDIVIASTRIAGRTRRRSYNFAATMPFCVAN